MCLYSREIAILALPFLSIKSQKMKSYFPLLLALTIILSCNMPASDTEDADKVRQEAQSFIDKYSKEMQQLYYASSKAEWQSNTRIVEGDTTNAVATRKANEAYAKYTGSKEVIQQAQDHLKNKDKLDALQVKQLDAILYAAAGNPETVEDIVREKIKADTEQNEKLFGFDFRINGESVSTNKIDEILREEKDLDKRLKAWEASKEVGIGLKPGLENLRNLKNKTVQALGYDDYFTYQVSDYGVTTEEMAQLMENMVKDIWPLYRELHTYARYELAAKYGRKDIPDLLPAHWLPNRWGQDWSSMVTVEGLDLDGILATKSKEWIVEQGERFYMSMGFPKLPEVFWEKSDLYPLPEDATYKKNNHASAWHFNLEYDVRSLMSVEPNASWYETSHHELGHIYYYLAYTNPDVPLLLRAGANRGYHEAIGSLLGLAAMQKPFLAELDLLPADAETDDTKILLKEALNYIVFIPFSAGVMTGFEHALYHQNLSIDEFNKKWWELKAKYQGIAPPAPRGEEFCDAASKTHINNDAAQYYDYAISYILLFQFHDHIARNILKQDPRATNYYGKTQVGDFLKKVLSPGTTRDWRELLRESTGEDMNARAMLRYFEPLMSYLKKVNTGRTHALPEQF